CYRVPSLRGRNGHLACDRRFRLRHFLGGLVDKDSTYAVCMSALGQKRTSERPDHVRFTPKSGHRLSALRCPLSAKSGHFASQQDRTIAASEKAKLIEAHAERVEDR